MINIAFCIDDNFAPYAAVSLVSLLSNTKSTITVYFIGNLSEEVKKCLESLKNRKTIVNFLTPNIPLPNRALSNRYRDRLSNITFVRYGIAEILMDLDKVIYLDADILVCGDIKNLWERPLNNFCLGAVLDHSLMSQHRDNTLSLKSKSYFNAGVLLIDLKIWRDMKIFEKLRSMHDSRESWEYNDQDVLNVVLDGQVKYFGAEMNAQTYSLVHDCIPDPIIVHFTGQEKPWHLSSVHPYTKQYRDFFENIPFVNNSLSLFLDNEDHLILEKLKEKFNTSARVVIWGAGARGRRLIKALEQNLPHIVIIQVVDTHLTGKCFSFAIASPKTMITDHVDAVVVATLPQKREITNSLRQNALTVI